MIRPSARSSLGGPVGLFRGGAHRDALRGAGLPAGSPVPAFPWLATAR